jgi:peptidoglycan hydrolase-like protein with peptidoglycan-binding domain
MRAAVGAIVCGWLCLAVAPKATAQDASTSAPSTAHKAKQKHSVSAGKRKSKKKKRGQQAIDSPRAREIQEALVRQHYLNGEPTGHWDAATEDALRRYQADQGWQTKTVPDSRALIKLGLGPSTEGLLNPESAMTAESAGVHPKVHTANPTDQLPSHSPAAENTPQR